MITENCFFKGVVEKNDSRTTHLVDLGINWAIYFQRSPVFVRRSDIFGKPECLTQSLKTSNKAQIEWALIE